MKRPVTSGLRSPPCRQGAVSPMPAQRPALCGGLTRRPVGPQVPLRTPDAELPASWQDQCHVSALHPQFSRKLSFQWGQVYGENKSYPRTVSKMHLHWNFVFWNNSAFARVTCIDCPHRPIITQFRAETPRGRTARGASCPRTRRGPHCRGAVGADVGRPPQAG